MTGNDPQTLNDPSLSDAIRRVWGTERAPESLRGRVTDLVAGPEEEAASPVALPAQRGNSVGYYVLAAAAIILLALGGVALVLMSPPDRGASYASTRLPDVVAKAMVSTHDACCQHEDHHGPGVPRDDFGLIAKELRARLGHPVVVGPLPATWTFHGASVCPVGGTSSAHLVFARKDGAISIFSLAATLVPGARENGDYEASPANHPIAGFVRDGGLYCVVGSGPSGDAVEVRAARDKLHRDYAATAESRVTVAGLSH